MQNPILDSLPVLTSTSNSPVQTVYAIMQSFITANSVMQQSKIQTILKTEIHFLDSDKIVFVTQDNVTLNRDIEKRIYEKKLKSMDL